MTATRRLLTLALAAAALVTTPATGARAGQPTAEDLLARATAILAPEDFLAQISFTTHRANGKTKEFSIRVWKKGSDKIRFKFLAPADDRNMEVLRIGDDMWNYLPNLKRSIRVSPRQEFHGGDFANSDVLRVDLVADYTAALADAAPPGERLLELTARNDQVAYQTVKFWIRAKDAMPLRQEFYSKAGKLVRKLEFSAPKRFGKLVRPSRCHMQNMLVRSRSTEMEWRSMTVTKLDDGALFDQVSLGR